MLIFWIAARIQPAGSTTGRCSATRQVNIRALIDNAGLKGVRTVRVISEKHAIYGNEVNGTASDYWNLINHVKKTVSEKFIQSGARGRASWRLAEDGKNGMTIVVSNRVIFGRRSGELRFFLSARSVAFCSLPDVIP